MVNPAGVVTITLGGGGRELTAAYSATYRLRVTDPEGLSYFARLATDCRGDAKTACTLPPGKKVAGAGTYGNDADWYRSNLRKGTVYTFAMVSDAYAEVALLDQSGGRSPRRTLQTASLR